MSDGISHEYLYSFLYDNLIGIQFCYQLSVNRDDTADKVSKETNTNNTIISTPRVISKVIPGVVLGNQTDHDSDVKCSELILTSDEYLTVISGGAGALLDHLTLHTSLGRKLSCGSSQGGEAFAIGGDKSAIVALLVGSGGHVHNLQALSYPLAEELQKPVVSSSSDFASDMASSSTNPGHPSGDQVASPAPAAPSVASVVSVAAVKEAEVKQMENNIPKKKEEKQLDKDNQNHPYAAAQSENSAAEKDAKTKTVTGATGAKQILNLYVKQLTNGSLSFLLFCFCFEFYFFQTLLSRDASL